MNRKSEKSDFIAPLNSMRGGHLVFLSDVAWMTILTDPTMAELARGSFEHAPPRVRVDGDAIMIQYRDLSPLKQLDERQPPAGSIILNPSIPWEVEFRGRTSNLTADLRGLELRSLDLLGGATQVELLVPNPIKTSFIYITGGIEASVIHVPAGAGVGVQVNGPIKDLFFDGQHFEAPGGKINRENTAFKYADSHYNICVTGGVINLTIDKYTALSLIAISNDKNYIVGES